MKKFLFFCAFIALSFQIICAQSQNKEQKSPYTLEENISYLKGDEYTNKRCVLDVYFPNSKEDLPTLIYFHGGGLKRGNKYIPDYLKEKGLIVVAVNYRFFPKVSVKEIIGDAAVSVKWVYDHIKKYGGSRDKIFLSLYHGFWHPFSKAFADVQYARILTC